MIAEDELAASWRMARPPMAGVHLDSAACSRQSFAVIDAAAAHNRHEAEVGGYVAAEAAQPVLDAGRSAVAAFTGMSSTDVVFTTGSQHALDMLLGSWPGPRTLACVRGEFGPNLAVMAAQRFDVTALPVDELGRVQTQAAADVLQAESPALVHLTGVGSHRGVVQPIAEMVALCAALDIPLILDAAQALGQVDCAVGAAAVYSSSRKWMAGPRGVGFLAVQPELVARLVRRMPPSDWAVPVTVLESFEHAEANVAARVGFAVAAGEYLAADPGEMRTRLAAVGKATRALLDGVAGWRVVEPADEPTAITTLIPPGDVDPVQVRSRLIAEHQMVTTVAERMRAPFELTGPVLRLSPHVDATTADLEACAEALTDVTRHR